MLFPMYQAVEVVEMEMALETALETVEMQMVMLVIQTSWLYQKRYFLWYCFWLLSFCPSEV